MIGVEAANTTTAGSVFFISCCLLCDDVIAFKLKIKMRCAYPFMSAEPSVMWADIGNIVLCSPLIEKYLYPQVKDGVAKQDVGSKPSDSAFALSLSTTNTRATLQVSVLQVLFRKLEQ